MGLELSRRYPPRELGRPSRSTKTRRSYLWNSSRARAPTPRIAGAEHEQTVSTSLARRGGLQTCHPARHMPCGPWRSSALRAPALTTPPCCSPPLRLAGCRGVGHDQRDEHMRSRRAARAPRAATRSVSEHLESLARRGDGGRLECDLKNPAREVEPDGEGETIGHGAGDQPCMPQSCTMRCRFATLGADPRWSSARFHIRISESRMHAQEKTMRTVKSSDCYPDKEDDVLHIDTCTFAIY